MRHVLTGLQHTQIARMAAPELVEWRTKIRGPDLRAGRDEATAAYERARARAALALTVWPR